MKLHVSQSLTFEDLLVPDGRTQALLLTEMAQKHGFYARSFFDLGPMPLVNVHRLPKAWRKPVGKRDAWKRRVFAGRKR